MKIWFRYLLQLFKEGCVGNVIQFLQHELRWAWWRVPLIQVPGRLRLVVRLSWGALHCSGLCWTAVHAKFGIDMVVLGEPWTTRSSKEGCTGPGRKRSRSKPPFLTVVGSQPWIDIAVQPRWNIGTQSFLLNQMCQFYYYTGYVFVGFNEKRNLNGEKDSQNLCSRSPESFSKVKC